MKTFGHLVGVLACTDCRSGSLDAAADGHEIVCSSCGRSFRVINAVPCFVAAESVDFSEVAPEKQAEFLEAKRMAYFGNSPLSSMYNHYHRFAAARRRSAGLCPRTLDIGFGVGEHYPHVTAEERQTGSFFGIDLDRFKLEYFAAGHPELPVLQADLFSLPFVDSCMDVVQLLAVLEHFSPAEIDRLLDEALRTLRPGGLLIVCYPAEGGLLLRGGQVLMHALIRFRTGFDLESEAVHRHRSTAAEVRALLGNRGNLERVETRFYPFNIPCLNLALFINEQYRKVH
jgi:SAM-dependent methyltransferase